MHNLLHCSCGSKWKEEFYLFLRVTVGLAFFFHGYQKVFVMGMENVTNYFNSVGIPAAEIMVYLVSYGELLGGLAIMIGLFTHWAAKIAALIVLGAIVLVHFGTEGGWLFGYGAPGGYEYQLLLLVSSMYLVVMGSGKYSVDKMFLDKGMQNSEVLSESGS